MNTLETLTTYKEIIRKEVTHGDSGAISGVALDSTDPGGPQLLVFCENSDAARTTVASLSGDLSSIQFIEGQILQGENVLPESAGIGEGGYQLYPSSSIRPAGGQEGRVGCFVRQANSSLVGAVTVRHLVHGASLGQKVSVCNATGCSVSDCRTVAFGDLAANSGLADCVLFSLAPNVYPNKGELTGGFVAEGALSSVKGSWVINSVSAQRAQVIDPDAPITFGMFLGKADARGIAIQSRVSLDKQILVRGLPFGGPGDSGAPILMASDGTDGNFRKSDVLGLYDVIWKGGEYHYVTPLFACFNGLGKYLASEEIFIPPAPP
jgi:hypothetical protein